ncbi:MAG TPA: DMT family transporter, partial [Longimicrobiaceae bacterium]
MRISSRAPAMGALVLVMLLWGSSFPVTKAALDHLPPLLFALLRFAVASAVLLPLAWMRGGAAALPDPRPWRWMVLMGVTGVALYYVGFNLSLSYTTASQGAVIQSLVPAATAVLARVWLGERIAPRRALGIGVAAVGAAVVVLAAAPGADARDPLLGGVLMLGTVAAWAVYTILGKRVAGADPLVVTAFSVAVGTVLLVPAAALEALVRPVAAIPAEGWWSALYLGAGASAAGYFLYNHALRTLDASQAANFLNLLPVVGVATAVLFLDEALAPAQLLGGV